MRHNSNILRSTTIPCWAFGILLLLMAAGCGPGGPERTIVSGTVTFDGQGVQEGTIRFVPTQDTTLPVSGAPIQDGQYRVDALGGVPVGAHRVEIEATRADPKAAAPGEEIPGVEGPPREQYIPAKYNRDSELQVTIESGQAVTKDFDLAK